MILTTGFMHFYFTGNKPYSCSRYWTGTSLQPRLMRGKRHHYPRLHATMSDKGVATLGSKIRFSCFWKHPPPPPFPQNNVDFSISSIAQTTAPTQHWIDGPGAGGIRGLTLDANKLEQMLKYRKSSFLKSVSTTFVAHCSSRPIPGILKSPLNYHNYDVIFIVIIVIIIIFFFC